jgi:hypothetical protein
VTQRQASRAEEGSVISELRFDNANGACTDGLRHLRDRLLSSVDVHAGCAPETTSDDDHFWVQHAHHTDNRERHRTSGPF